MVSDPPSHEFYPIIAMNIHTSMLVLGLLAAISLVLLVMWFWR